MKPAPKVEQPESLVKVIRAIILGYKAPFTSDDVIDELVKANKVLNGDKYILADVVSALNELMTAKQISYSTCKATKSNVEESRVTSFTQIFYKVLD